MIQQLQMLPSDPSHYRTGNRGPVENLLRNASISSLVAPGLAMASD